MNEMLVAVFDTEDAAARGMRTLSELHDEGGISLYGSALIVKDRDGRISVKQHSGEAPLGTSLGLMVGGIVGILGGPAGAAVGASLGGYLGLLADWARHGIDLKFLDDIGKTLDVGKAAVLAEIEQSWVSPLEQRLTQQGGTVFRRFRTDLVDDQLLREGMALQKALETLEDELDKATAAHREALLENVADVKQQLRTIQDRAKAAIELKTVETELKLKALRAQEEVAGHDTKAQIKKRVADAQADLEIRSKKLNEAWDLAKQALASQPR